MILVLRIRLLSTGLLRVMLGHVLLALSSFGLCDLSRSNMKVIYRRVLFTFGPWLAGST